MKIRSSILAMLAIAAVAAGCSASSQSGPGEPGSPAEDTEAAGSELSAGGPGGRMFAEADADKDGKLTLAEAQASAVARFSAVDANKDGQVDEAEMQAMHGQRGGPKMMKHLDKNADGKISKEEAPERMRGHFDQIDANKDGLIDEAEMESAHGHRGGPGMIKHLDKNGDGKVSKEEAPERMREHFDDIDANKDGQIEEQELQAMRQRHGGPGHPDGQQAGGKRGGMMMKGLDADNDGKISQAEFTAKVPQWFARFDANSDGVVTAEEIKARRPRGPRGAR